MRMSRIMIETAPDTDVFPRNVPIRGLRNGSPSISSPRLAADCRAYLRRLRAAEMEAWEQTGGDCLLSQYVARERKVV
jgi:hypothetical protein